jgi:hypothetical protein
MFFPDISHRGGSQSFPKLAIAKKEQHLFGECRRGVTQ